MDRIILTNNKGKKIRSSYAQTSQHHSALWLQRMSSIPELQKQYEETTFEVGETVFIYFMSHMYPGSVRINNNDFDFFRVRTPHWIRLLDRTSHGGRSLRRKKTKLAVGSISLITTHGLKGAYVFVVFLSHNRAPSAQQSDVWTDRQFVKTAHFANHFTAAVFVCMFYRFDEWLTPVRLRKNTPENIEAHRIQTTKPSSSSHKRQRDDTTSSCRKQSALEFVAQTPCKISDIAHIAEQHVVSSTATTKSATTVLAPVDVSQKVTYAQRLYGKSFTQTSLFRKSLSFPYLLR